VTGIRLAREEHACVVAIHGELDAFNAEELTQAFDEAGANGTEAVVIDLSRVSFMDSTALGCVVRKVNEVTEGGGRAKVVLPETSARRIFEITTLDRVLPVAGTRDDALRAVTEDGR
jgi:anti-sigma B factor antagonist